MANNNFTRRDFNHLTIAAIGGIVTGTLAVGQSDVFGETSTSLLLQDPHVCRGLNTCKGKGSCKTAKNKCKGKNACAGQGKCATAEKHGCHGHNACKGQSGCGEKPGENACKGKGKCAVPLSDKAWKKARTRFEAAMKQADKTFGPAPAK